MSRQDKATTERNAKTLRELIKRPENKVCADCKRNDPRWASWNLGVFVCIRCSGIHRSMGTHISKVKSVDLDMWTPDQMKNVQNWGNERANLYWEAHLKAGHVPPDHKMDSFIRSKYELKRWAMEGPPPADPSVLDDRAAAPPPEPEAVAPPPPQAPVVSPTPTGAAANTAASSRRPQRSLLSASTFTPPAVNAVTPSAASAPAPVASASADLFSLDFTPPTTSHAHSPSLSSSSQPQQPRKDLKNDILSLYSSAPAPAPAAAANPQQQQAFASPTAPTSFMGTGGTGLWGASSGWSAPAPAPAPSNGLSGWDTTTPAGGFNNAWPSPAVPAAAPNPASIWGAAPAAQPATMSAFDMFAMGGGGTSTGAGAGTGAGGAAAKKDDVFGDIWK